MSEEIDFSENIIDTRDIIEKYEEIDNELTNSRERIEEIREELKPLSRDIPDQEEDYYALKDELNDLEGYIEDLIQENLVLMDFVDKYEDEIPEFTDGAVLIRDDYFVEYAQQLADDIYDIEDSRWPFCHIDWDEAAEALQQDYAIVEIAGDVYWYRNV
jgi:predicted nuclease with TOPRIM domain